MNGIANTLRDISQESKLNPAEKASLKAIAKEFARLTARDYQECRVFVDHIKAHLNAGQFVVCKICGKTINEIWHEQALKAPAATERDKSTIDNRKS